VKKTHYFIFYIKVRCQLIFIVHCALLIVNCFPTESDSLFYFHIMERCQLFFCVLIYFSFFTFNSVETPHVRQNLNRFNFCSHLIGVFTFHLSKFHFPLIMLLRLRLKLRYGSGSISMSGSISCSRGSQMKRMYFISRPRSSHCCS